MMTLPIQTIISFTQQGLSPQSESQFAKSSLQARGNLHIWWKSNFSWDFWVQKLDWKTGHLKVSSSLQRCHEILLQEFVVYFDWSQYWTRSTCVSKVQKCETKLQPREFMFQNNLIEHNSLNRTIWHHHRITIPESDFLTSKLQLHLYFGKESTMNAALSYRQ